MKPDELKVGAYAMKNGTLVRIDSSTDGAARGTVYGISYIPTGGGSFWWEAREFEPITDPLLIAVAKWHKCQCDENEFRNRSDQARVEKLKWQGVEQCIREGREASAPQTGGGEV